jgi:hypothetical protein
VWNISPPVRHRSHPIEQNSSIFRGGGAMSDLGARALCDLTAEFITSVGDPRLVPY